MLIDTTHSRYARVRSLPQGSLKWQDGFWLDRFNTCADVTIPHVLSVFDDKESFFHQVENFRIAAGLSDGAFRGTPYGDGDFYKLMEGMIYVYAFRGGEALAQQIDNFIALIAAAQQEDGYISTKQIIGERLSNGTVRHGDINDFEEYNFGHLFTAACMHKRVTGKDTFMQVAARCAGYLNRMYQAILSGDKATTAVCPSHYMGLFELYRTTGDETYLEMGKTAIQLRSRVESGTDDNQDRIPLLEHREIVGHAVRSTYLYAGVADLYLETGDAAYLPVLESCWQDLMDKKLYITGGCGALYTGTSPFGLLLDAQYVHQAFGYAYQLPNVTAYNETCGTLGHIFWAHRMFALNPKAEYMDLIERSHYNLVLAAISLSGDKYFYENMLRRTKKLDYPTMWPLERSDTFACFCCPTNLARSIPQAMDYAYKLSDDAIWCGMYGASEAEIVLENGAMFTLRQETNYPWSGDIRFSVTNTKTAAPFTLKVRVPSWLQTGSITCAEAVRTLTAADANTFVDIAIATPEGAVVAVTLDMPVRYTEAHPMVEETVNQVCVQRGPLVYCVENPDVDAESLDDLMLLSDAVFTEEWYSIQNTSVLALRTEAALVQRAPEAQAEHSALYRPLRVTGLRKTKLRLIPYFAWDNRGFGEMRIWMPVHYQLEASV